MKIKYSLFLSLAIGVLLSFSQAVAQQTTAFTYQGQLRDGGTNANGNYTMTFKLYDAATGTNQIGGAITNSPTLANGLFSVNLDFGAGAFNGAGRWLDITAQSGTTAPETLTPRVQVLPAPYALYAAVAATVTNHAIMNSQLATNAVAMTNIQNNAITTLQIADGAVTNRNIASNSVTSDKLAVDSAALARVTGGAAFVANNVVSFTGGGVTLAHNYGTNGNSVWNIENGYSEVLGFPGAFVDSLFFVGPSGLPAAQIWDQPASALGGRGISAINVFATGTLGLRQGAAGTTLWNINVANFQPPQGPSWPDSLMLSAGNTPVMVVASDGSGAGLYGNFSATGQIRAIGGIKTGATDNGAVSLTASGNIFCATLTASGNISCASISAIGAIFSNGNIRGGDIEANGNIRGNDVEASGNMWATSFNQWSDRNLKEKFTPIDKQEILERVASLPISQWNFKTDAATRHIGPMAQDFYAAFNVGPDDKHIATVDADGVALAAIQGLHEVVKEKEAEIAALKQRLTDLEKAVSALAKQKGGTP